MLLTNVKQLGDDRIIYTNTMDIGAELTNRKIPACIVENTGFCFEIIDILSYRAAFKLRCLDSDCSFYFDERSINFIISLEDRHVGN